MPAEFTLLLLQLRFIQLLLLQFLGMLGGLLLLLSLFRLFICLVRCFRGCCGSDICLLLLFGGFLDTSFSHFLALQQLCRECLVVFLLRICHFLVIHEFFLRRLQLLCFCLFALLLGSFHSTLLPNQHLLVVLCICSGHFRIEVETLHHCLSMRTSQVHLHGSTFLGWIGLFVHFVCLLLHCKVLSRHSLVPSLKQDNLLQDGRCAVVVKLLQLVVFPM